MLRRQTALEFPDAQAAGGGMETVREGLSSIGHSLARGGASVRSSLAGRGGGSGAGGTGGTGDAGGQVDKLERLAALHARGALTDEEFAAAKRELLSR